MGLDPSEELSKMAKEVAIQEGIDVKFVSSGAKKCHYQITILIPY